MEKSLKRSAIYKARIDELKTLLVNDQISSEGFEDARRMAAWHYSREPMNLGSGMYVNSQFSTYQLVEGDVYFDADYGDVTWDGHNWCQTQLRLVGEELLPQLIAI